MEERFAVHTALDMDACRVLANVSVRRWNYVVAWVALGAAVFGLGLGFAFGMGEIHTLVLVTCVIGSGVLLYYIRIGIARRIYRALQIPGVETDSRFFDDAVRRADELGKGEASYRSYSRFVECRGYYLLFIGTGMAVVLKKSGFTVGNPDDFPAFIFEKTGLKPERVK